MYNSTDEPKSAFTCTDIDVFWVSGIDVFDSSGQRMQSLEEEEKRISPGDIVKWLPMCSRNFMFSVPPHSCVHGTFSQLEPDFSRDLRRYYSLPPGRYVIVPAERGRDGTPVNRTLPEPNNGLTVIVQEPQVK